MMTGPRHLLSLALLAAVFPLAMSGCATTARTALEHDNARLEREVARLQADKASLDAQRTALDDRLLILQRRLERCPSSDRPELPVVRLGARQTFEERAIETPAPERPRAATGPEPTGQRPVLTLDGSTPGPNRGQRRPVLVAGSGDFQNLGPDDLGVVAPRGTGQAASLETSMDAFNDAYRMYANKRYGEALEAFAAFLRDSPDHDYADNALFWRGECYFASGRVLKAIGELERLVARYPRSDKKASALYRVGFAYDKLGDRTRALEYYFRVVDNHPGTDAARRASRRVAVLQEAGVSIGAAVQTAAKR